MGAILVGKRISLTPFSGDTAIGEEGLQGSIEGIIRRPGFQRTFDYFLVRLDRVLRYQDPASQRVTDIDHVLVFPDGVELEWAYNGKGPEGLPVLVKVFAVISPTGTPNYSTGEKILLARGAAKAGEGP